MVIRARVSEDRQDDGLTDPGPDRHAVTGDRAKLAKVLVPDVMATHHDRRTAWPDRQSRESPAVRITSYRAVLPPGPRQRSIHAKYPIDRNPSSTDSPTSTTSRPARPHCNGKTQVSTRIVFSSPAGALRRVLPGSSAAISTAGLTLAASFALVAIIPLATFHQIAFTMGIGLLIDTFIVRPVLTPSLLTVLGRASSWPSRRFAPEPATPVTAQPPVTN